MDRVKHKPDREAPTIGRLSRQTGVNIETIRYYERIGLLPAAPRSPGRQRIFSEAHRQRLRFIRRARELGFSLDQVRDLLGLGPGHTLACGEVKEITERHIAGVRQKIRDLRRLERVLEDLATRCQGGKAPDCPILDALGGRQP